MLPACFRTVWLSFLLLTFSGSLWANPMPAVFYPNGANSFVVRTPGMRAIFSASGVEYRHAAARMRADFENANSSVVIEGEGPLPGVVNFLLGDDPRQWRVGVPVYSGVIYRNLYPGIDLRYYTKDGELKAEYLLSPGANHRRIRLRYSGAQPAIESGGGLVARSEQGELRESRPVTFGRNRRSLKSRFALMGGGVTGIEIEGAAANETVVFDPVITFSSYIGGAAFDALTSVATDGSGNVYAAGWTESADFPVLNALQAGFGGSVDAVVVKVNAANALVYATYLGGSGDDRAFGIAVDSSGNVAVSGWSYSSNFPKVNAAQSAIGGGRDAFVAKLNPSGNTILFSTWLGGSGSDSGNAVAFDSSGNIYVAGQTTSVNFPVVNAYQPSNRGGSDAFVAKYSGSGGKVFCTFFGGVGDDRATAIAVDSFNAVYIAGSTYSPDLPVLNAFQSALGGGQDAFVAKLNSSGSSIAYSTYLGGWNKAGEFEEASGIAVDGWGNAVVSGTTSSKSFPVLMAMQPAIAGGTSDGFVVKLTSTGSNLVFGTYLGGAAEDQLKSVTLAADGAIIVAGYTGSSNFPLMNPLQDTKASGYDAIVARMSANGANLEFSTFLGGNDQDDAQAVKLDSSSNIVIAGQTQSYNFPSAVPLQSLNGGLYGGFLTKIQFTGDTTAPTVTITSPITTSTYSTSSASLNLAGTASDNVGVTKVSWSCDVCGNGLASGTTSWSFSGITLKPGANAITVTAQDAAGNQGSAPLTVTYTPLDTTLPTVTITSPVSTPTYSTPNPYLNLGGTASDNVGVTKVSWSCDRCGGGIASGTTSWSVSGITLQPGVNVITVTAQDAAGYQSSALLTVTCTDTTPPAVTITSPVSTPTYSTSSPYLNLGGTASDNVGVTQVSWSCDRCGSGVAVGTTSWTVAGITLQIGANKITVTAQDAAGNQSSALFTVTYIDATPPTATITSPVSTPTYSTPSPYLNLSGTASDNVGVTQVSWSCDRCGSGIASGTTSWSISGITLQPGVNVITVTAQDAAGYQSSALLTVTYIDATPPTATITSPVSTPTYSTSAPSLNLGGTASDNVGVTKVSWSCDRCGSGVAVGTTSWTVAGITLQIGANKITVTAQDAAMNQSSALLTVTYIDATPPTATITSPVSTPTYSTSSPYLNLGGTASDNVGVTKVSWSCDRCGSGIASGTTSWSASGITLQPGVNVITVTAHDAAGNQSAALFTVTYIDAIPPTVTITSPGSMPTYSTPDGILNPGGTASDNVGVTQVSWSCDRCGSGIASGTTSWSVSGITLQPGANVITVTAQDAAGNQGSAKLTVTYTPLVTSCGFTLGFPRATAAGIGGTGSPVGVIGAAGCSGSVQSMAAWITVTSGASVSGGGAVAYTVAANSGVLRSGSITIDDQTFTVSQAARLTVPASKVGALGGGYWVQDLNGNFAWDGSNVDRVAYFSFGLAGEIPVYGDWNGDGKQKLGAYVDGYWVLDYNGNGQWDGMSVDKVAFFGGPGWTPVVGDWNGDGRAKIGAFKDGIWALDYDGNFAWNPPTDKVVFWGGAGYTPVVGDWNNTGWTKIGAYKDGLWVIDYDGNFAWNPPTDKVVFFGGTGATPLVGDWNGSGTAKIGVSLEGVWLIDFDGNYQWDGAAVDKITFFGGTGWTPMVGDWDGSGTTKIGVYQAGTWVLDYNGNYTYDDAQDKVLFFGGPGQTPVVGKW